MPRPKGSKNKSAESTEAVTPPAVEAPVAQEAPKVEAATKEEAQAVPQYVIMHGVLDRLQKELSEQIERTARPQNKSEGPETCEVIRMGSARLLANVCDQLKKFDALLADLKKLEVEVSAKAKGLATAKEYINSKSETHRAERDIFMKVKNLDEASYLKLLAVAKNS